MRVSLFQGKLPAIAKGFDAVVTSANPLLCGNAQKNYWRHNGRENVDGAIRSALKEKELSAYINQHIKGIPLNVGSAVHTPVTGLLKDEYEVKHLIHVVAPDFLYPSQRNEDNGEAALLRSYESVFEQAKKMKEVKRLLVTPLGTGVRGFRDASSAKCAKQAFSNSFPQKPNLEEIAFVLLEPRALHVWKAVWSKP